MAEITPYSVYRNSFEREDAEGNQYTTDAEPFLYDDLPDNIEHTVDDGQTWGDIAHLYWHPIPQAKSYWRYIIEFQPEPFTDPFVPPAPGAVVIVPSRNTLETKILQRGRIGVSF